MTGWAAFADSLPVIAWRARPDGTVEQWNRRWFATTGASAGNPAAEWIERIHPDDRAIWPAALLRFAAQPAPFNGTFRIWSVVHNEYRLHLARVAPQIDSGGRITAWTGVAIDLEEHTSGGRIRALEDELSRERDELRNFAYGASHDLREPVRMVQSYVELLSRRHGEKLDDQAREYIRFALEGAERMRLLTDDLLTYSRAAAVDPLTLQKVQMTGVIQWAMMNLARIIEEAGAAIVWETLPAVMADENRLVLVVQNLLSNTIKFRRPDRPLRVHITAEQADGEWIFCVADNGAGFDEQYADQVFGLFKRLHGREYPGSGMGLAIAKKIVERHGGRMWAHSTSGEGSRFYFSLPD